MDVRSIEGVPASPEHKGTVPVWWLYRPREMKAATLGGYLELVSEFEVKGGGYVHPHQHNTHEFYYVVSGRGIMTIAGEERQGSGAYPAGYRAQFAAGEHTRLDPVLLLCGRPAQYARGELLV